MGFLRRLLHIDHLPRGPGWWPAARQPWPEHPTYFSIGSRIQYPQGLEGGTCEGTKGLSAFEQLVSGVRGPFAASAMILAIPCRDIPGVDHVPAQSYH